MGAAATARLQLPILIALHKLVLFIVLLRRRRLTTTSPTTITAADVTTHAGSVLILRRYCSPYYGARGSPAARMSKRRRLVDVHVVRDGRAGPRVHSVSRLGLAVCAPGGFVTDAIL